jgi:hypothetical protein
LAQALARIVDQGETGPIRQVSVAKAKIRTPWNPTGAKVRAKLSRTVRMNGFTLRERMMSDEEITLLNQVQPGKYHDKKWVVMQVDGDADGSAIDLFIPNKTHADQIETVRASVTGDLAGILRVIVAEHAARA